MSIPERETTLTININPETGIMDGMEIAPQSFSQAALKQILRSQIFAERPKDLIIQGVYATSFWSSVMLSGIRKNYKGKERLQKIKNMAREMKRADKILFQKPDVI